MKYYKSVRIIDGKLKWVIIDEDYSIIKNPTKEQFKMAIRAEPPKRCCICRKSETYIDPGGKKRWYGHKCNGQNCTGSLCDKCYKDNYRRSHYSYIGRDIGHTNTICCICKNEETGKNFNGNTDWIRYAIDKEGNYNRHGHWDGKSYICTKCYADIKNNMEDSYRNAIKSVANSRTGNLDRSCSTGEAIISQWVCAMVLGLKDMNIENDNFNEPIDLSTHCKHGNVDVKNGKWIENRGYWQVDLENHNSDTLAVLCGGQHKPWKCIERVYIIPKGEIKDSMTIAKDPSRRSKWENFRVDERPYNDIYHSVDIPKYFSPFDLWKGKYSKKNNTRINNGKNK